ncbi:hypothetical protein NBRC116594_12140 [Shimia sp. NS0008-38b]
MSSLRVGTAEPPVKGASRIRDKKEGVRGWTAAGQNTPQAHNLTPSFECALRVGKPPHAAHSLRAVPNVRSHEET